MPETKPKLSWWGINSLLLGLVSTLFGAYTAIPAVIISHIAVAKIKDPEKRGTRLAITGAILGYFWILIPPPLFFGAKAAQEAGNRAEAANTVHNLRNAISAYHTEYRRFYPTGENSDKTHKSDHSLMSVLQGADTELAQKHNPRGITFFFAPQARQRTNGKWYHGIAATSTGSGALYDPWGNLYQIKIDPAHHEEPIQIWSLGADGRDQTNDDIKTW